MMMKPQIFGTRKLVFQKSVSNVGIWQIISGQWVYPDHADHVQRFIMIVAQHMAPKVDRLRMKIDILKSGTLFSCKMNVALVEEKIATQSLVNFQQRVLILVLV